MTKEEAKEKVDKMFEPTAENSIRDMKLAKMFFITKKGKFYSSIANTYINKMKTYTIYCNDEGKQYLIKEIETLIGFAGEMDDSELLLELRSREQAVKVMELISNGASWEEVRQFAKENVFSNFGISYLGQIMLRYSSYGIEFVDNIIGEKHLKLLSCLNEEYEKQIKKQKSKKLVLKTADE